MRIHPTRVGSPPSSIGLDFTNGSQSATASNRRIVAQTFSAGASMTLLTKTRGITKLLRRDLAPDGLKLLQNHAFGEHFWKNNRLFVLRRIEHVQWNTRAAELLQ